MLCDWDTEGSDPSDDGIVEIPDGRGGTQLANVAEYPVSPLEPCGHGNRSGVEGGWVGIDAISRSDRGAPLGAL